MMRNLPDFCSARAFLVTVLASLLFVTCSNEITFATESPHSKLAVSSTDGPGSTLADLLMTELARTPDVTMLERADLDKVMREQALTGSSSGALVKAGTLLGADGIVVIDARNLASRTWISMRVIAVRHGVALGWWAYTISNEQKTSWSKGAAEQVRALLPKLTSTGKKASPISFVGFASPSSSRSSTSLEREINSLLLTRLGAEPDLLVLERQKLLDAAFEKVLSGDDRKFWNGAYLLEGTINPERIEAASISVHARLVPPGGGAPVDFIVNGLRTNLAEVGTLFIGEIRRALHSKASGVSWDSTAEARRFYDQAETVVRWQFWPEAAAAADTALALGKDDLDTKRVRLEAYIGWFRLGPKEASGMRIRPRFGMLEGYIEPPSAAQFQAAMETAYQLRDLTAKTNALGNDRLKAVAVQATEALGWFTLRYYFGADLRNGNEEKLAALRDTMREFIDLLLQTPETANAFIPALLKFGPFWEETPEEGVKLHQRLRALPGFLAYQISQQASTRFSSPMDDLQISDWTPPLCGWKWADRSRVDQVWETYAGPPRTPDIRLSQQPPKRQSSAPLAPPQLLAVLSQSVSNRQIPSSEVLRQLRTLSSLPEREQALGFLKQLQQLPFSPTNGMNRPELMNQIFWLNFETQKAHEDVNSDAFNQMRVPPQLRTIGATNCLGLHTALRVPQRPDGNLSAKFVPLTQSSRAEIYQLSWAEDRLWIYYQAMKHIHWEAESGSGDGYSAEYFISAFSPSSGELETIQIPEPMLSIKENKAAAEFAVFAQRIILFLEHEALIYDRGRKSFSSTSSPLKSAHVFQLGKRLLLYNEETVLETSGELGNFTVLASVHRRPALSPLDNLPSLQFQLFHAGPDRAFLLVSNSLYEAAKGQFKTLPRPEAARTALIFPEECLLHESEVVDRRVKNHRLIYFGLGIPDGELWWAGHDVPDLLWQRRWLPSIAGNAARYPFLVESPLNTDLATFIPFHRRPVTFTFPRTPGDAQLNFWRCNHWRPLTLTVTGGGRPFDGSPIIGNRTLVAGGEIFAWAPNVGGIWHIPGFEAFSAFEKLLDNEEKRLATQAQELQRILVPYDTNKNGKLDQEEYAALAQEPALFNLVWCELDQNHNNLIDSDEIGFFDFNHDGKLDPVEHQAFLNAVSYLAGAVFPFLDKNGDGFLQESETKDYCGAILSVRGLFAKHDKAGTGRLDLSAWTGLMAELLDRRFASGTATRPPIGPIATAGRQYFLEPAVIEHYLERKGQ